MQEINPKKCLCLHKCTILEVIYWSSLVSANVISAGTHYCSGRAEITTKKWNMQEIIPKKCIYLHISKKNTNFVPDLLMGSPA